MEIEAGKKLFICKTNPFRWTNMKQNNLQGIIRLCRVLDRQRRGVTRHYQFAVRSQFTFGKSRPNGTYKHINRNWDCRIVPISVRDSSQRRFGANFFGYFWISAAHSAWSFAVGCGDPTAYGQVFFAPYGMAQIKKAWPSQPRLKVR